MQRDCLLHENLNIIVDTTTWLRNIPVDCLFAAIKNKGNAISKFVRGHVDCERRSNKGSELTLKDLMCALNLSPMIATNFE